MSKTFKVSAIAASLVLSGMLIGCGGSSSSKKDTDPDPTPAETKNFSLTVVDGYVQGATVSEQNTTGSVSGNGADGKYTATVPKATDETKLTYKSTGGWIDANGDGKRSTGDINAPALSSLVGGKVLNPFTTRIVTGDVSAEELKAAFKLPADADLGADYLADANKSAPVVKTAIFLGTVSASTSDIMAAVKDSNATDTNAALQVFADANTTSATDKAIAEAVLTVSDADVVANGSKAVESNPAFQAALPADKKITVDTGGGDKSDIHDKDDIKLPTK